MCVENKQFELLEFVFYSIFVDQQGDDIHLTHVVVYDLSVRLYSFPM